MSKVRAVIGAGIAGLLAAQRGLERGEEIVVFGANPGGLIDQIELGGGSFDCGAEAFSTVGPQVLTLLSELGLDALVVYPEPNSANIISEVGRYRIPQGILGLPADLNDSELSSIFSPQEIELAKTLDSAPFAEFDSVSDLVRARLGESFLQRLVNPVLSGVHGSTADQLSAELTYGSLLASARELGSLTAAVAKSKQASTRPGASVASLAGGMGTLITELLKKLSASGVSFVDADVDWAKPVQGGFALSARGAEHRVAALSLCAGAGFIAKRLQGFVKLSQLAASVREVDVAIVLSLAHSSALNEFPLGPGALITEAAGFKAKATTHANAKWAWLQSELGADRHLIRLSFGRNGLLPQGDLVELARAEISAIYDVSDLRILDAKSIVWQQGLVQADPELTREILSQLQEIDADLELAGGFISGNGILGIVRDHMKRRAA